MTKLEWALAHAREGFRVFPLLENGKSPPYGMNGWPTRATRDEAQIRQWWADSPNANIAGVTDGFFVIDIDPRNNGTETFSQFELVEDIPETRRSRTAGGGIHLIYKLPPDDRPGKGILGVGVDVQTSTGAYIVMPGSVVNGRPYAWENEHAFVVRPQWARDLCKKNSEQSPMAGVRLVEEDETSIELAEHYIRNHAPEASQGHIDNTAFAVAAKLYDVAVTRATCELMLMEWSETHCSPPMQQSDIERIARSAEKNRRKAIGCGHPLAHGLEPVDISASYVALLNPKHPLYKGPPGLLEGFLDAAFKALTEAAEPLIKGVLDRGAMSIIYGESNAGKTFVAYDMAFHIAAGLPWGGRRARKGAVLYVAAEGGKGVYKRLAALQRRYADAGDVPLYTVRLPIDLLHGRAHVDLIGQLCKQAEERSGLTVELIVIDTLSRALAGGDENSSTDMGAIVKNFDAIRDLTGAHLAVIHHSGKDKARGARGHSLLRAATDTEIEIDANTISTTKQRDLDGDFRIGFSLVAVSLGADRDGDHVVSCTVNLRQNGAAFDHVDLDGETSVFADKIERMVRERCDKELISVVGQSFRTSEAYRAGSDLFPHEETGLTKASKDRVDRLLLNLLKSSWLKKHKQGQWVINFPQLPQTSSIGPV